MADDGPRIISPNVSATSTEVQRAIGDALTKCTADLMAKHALEPAQIVKGVLAFLWDFDRLLMHRTPRELAEQALYTWGEMNRRTGRKV